MILLKKKRKMFESVHAKTTTMITLPSTITTKEPQTQEKHFNAVSHYKQYNKFQHCHAVLFSQGFLSRV